MCKFYNLLIHFVSFEENITGCINLNEWNSFKSKNDFQEYCHFKLNSREYQQNSNVSLLLHYQQFFRIDHAFQNSFPSFSYNPFLHRNLFEMIENQKCSIPLSFKTIIETHRFKFTSVPRCRGIKSVRDILEKILRLNDPLRIIAFLPLSPLQRWPDELRVERGCR